MVFNINNIPIYDPSSGKIVNISSEYVNSLETQKTGRSVNIVHPDGSSGSVDEADLPYFLNKGYHVETAKEKDVNDYLDQNKGLSGSLKAAGLSALNELTFGATDPILKNTLGEQAKAKIEGLAKQHEIASGLGAAAGFAGSLAYGGELFKGAELAGKAARTGILGAEKVGEGLARKSIGKAIEMGTEGALLSAPATISEATFGDPNKAAEHLMYGLGAGAVLGAISPTLKGTSKFLVNQFGAPVELKLTERGLATDLADMSEKQAVKSMFNTQNKQLMGEINNLNEKHGINVGRYALDNGLVRNVNEDFISYAERMEKAREEVGQRVGNLVRQVGDEKVISADDIIDQLKNSKLFKRYEESAAFKNEYNKAKSYIDELEDKFKSFDGTSAMEVNYQNELNKLSAMTDPVQRETQAKIVNSLRDQLVSENKNISLYKLWQESHDLGEKAFKSGKARIGDPDEISQLLNNFRQIIKDNIDKKGNEAAEKIGIKGWLNDFKKANNDFQAANEISKIAQNSADSLSNRNFSLTDNIWGAGALSSSSLTNPLGFASGMLGSIASKFVRENGNSFLAKYGNKASLYIMEQAEKLAKDELGKIPKLLINYSKNVIEHGPQVGVNAISRLIGSDEKDPVKSYEQLQTKLAEANAAKLPINQALKNGIPGIQKAYENANNNILNYLNQNMPKDPNAGKPYAKPWKPSKQQLSDLSDKIDVINNPFGVFNKLGNGTLNKNHINALKAIYPNLYTDMVNKINEHGFSNPDMPYSKKLRLSNIIGIPLENNVGNYQSIYLQSPAQNNSGSGGGKKINLKNLTGSEPTNNQRIMGK